MSKQRDRDREQQSKRAMQRVKENITPCANNQHQPDDCKVWFSKQKTALKRTKLDPANLEQNNLDQRVNKERNE